MIVDDFNKQSKLDTWKAKEDLTDWQLHLHIYYSQMCKWIAKQWEARAKAIQDSLKSSKVPAPTQTD